MDDNTIQAISQKKLDSLAAKHLHVSEQVKLNRFIRLVDLLAIGVPILYAVPRFLFKGTAYAGLVETGWEIIAAFLVTITILKINYRWDERAQIHSKLLGENISLVRQADDLLSPGGPMPDTVQLFLRLAERSETADREAIGQPSQKKKQFAYREALKELEPGKFNVVCPHCNASPYSFSPGSCQLCGNTPVRRS